MIMLKGPNIFQLLCMSVSTNSFNFHLVLLFRLYFVHSYFPYCSNVFYTFFKGFTESR